MENKKLYLSNDKKIGGVCAGLAEYFGIDTALVRIAYALLTIFSAAFPGVLLYLIAWAVLPNKN